MNALPHPLRRLAATALFACLTSLSISTAHAVPRDDSQLIKNAVESFLRSQTTGMPGQASFVVSTIEASPSRPACTTQPEVAMAPGARSIGRTTVLVRCRDGAGWSIYVPVQVKLVGEYLVTARSISQGQTLSDNDLGRQSGDLGELPAGVMTDPALVVGRAAAVPLPPGRPITVEQLRQPPVVQQGQSVKVVSRGPGFEVAADGRALTSAAEGKVVQVRLNSGQVVSGLARPGGIVEIAF